jgi:hypothetical protein
VRWQLSVDSLKIVRPVSRIENDDVYLCWTVWTKDVNGELVATGGSAPLGAASIADLPEGSRYDFGQLSPVMYEGDADRLVVVLWAFESSSDEKAKKTKDDYSGPVASLKSAHRELIEATRLAKFDWSVHQEAAPASADFRHFRHHYYRAGALIWKIAEWVLPYVIPKVWEVIRDLFLGETPVGPAVVGFPPSARNGPVPDDYWEKGTTHSYSVDLKQPKGRSAHYEVELRRVVLR